MSTQLEYARANVSFALDDALALRTVEEALANSKTRFVLFDCGFEPLVVAVFSYLPDCRVDDSEAEDIAVDFLRERNWFDVSKDCEALRII